MAESILRIIDLAPLAIRPSTSIRELLGRINASPHLFQIVLDEGGRLIGTATDGDVRRALLAGKGLDAEAAACMQTNPKSGLVGEWEANRRKLAEIASVVPFLPLIDQRGRAVEVLVLRRETAIVAAGLVMAGGRGVRLGARTDATPKPLLAIGGRPMLDRALTRLEEAGVEDIYVSVNYLGDQIEQYCGSRTSRARLHILRESTPTGTAGATGMLPPTIAGPVLVMNGDVVTEVDLRALVAFSKHQGLDACLAVAHHEVEIPFGVVHADANGNFETIVEKPKLKNYVAAGIYVLGEAIRGLVQANARIDMPDLLNEGRRAGLRIGVFPIHEYWRDVGRPGDLDAAERESRERGK